MQNRWGRAGAALVRAAALGAGLSVPACARSRTRAQVARPVRAEAPLRIPLPRTVPVAMVVYFRPAEGALPEPKELQTRVASWVDQHASGPARDVLKEYLRRGLLLIRVGKKQVDAA